MKKVNMKKHTIIAGWNFQGERIVSELLKCGEEFHQGVVVLAKREQRPIKDDRVDFINDDPTQDDALIRAGIKTVNSVIVLSDLTKSMNDADAEALMIALAVESLNRNAHTCVQIMNSANRIHLEHAHIDEIICLDQLGGNLSVASAMNHGVSCVLNELLTFNRGSEFYRYNIDPELVGKEFYEAAGILGEKRTILLGFETDDSEEFRKKVTKDVIHKLEEDGRVIVVNPQSHYTLQEGDALFLVAESMPGKV